MLFIAMGTEPFVGPDLQALSLFEGWQAMGISFMAEANWLKPGGQFNLSWTPSVWHQTWELEHSHIHAWDLQ